MGVRRPLNARRVVLSMLRAARTDLVLARDRWSVARTVYVPPAQRTDPSQVRRPRGAHEYPEHRAADWQVLDRECTHMIEQLDAVRQYAREQLDRLACTTCRRLVSPERAAAGIRTCGTPTCVPAGR